MKPSKPKQTVQSPTRLHNYDAGRSELEADAPAAKEAMQKIWELGRKHLERRSN